MFAIFYRGVLDGAILDIPENSDRIIVETPFSATAYTNVGMSTPWTLEFVEDTVMPLHGGIKGAAVKRWFPPPGKKVQVSHTAELLDSDKQSLTFIDKSSAII